MCDPEQLAVSDGSESDAAPGEPDDEPEPYRPVLPDEEREVLRREWLAALRPLLLADIEQPDRGGSRHAEPSRPIRRQAASVPSGSDDRNRACRRSGHARNKAAVSSRTDG